jgi:hypothetical protein
LIAFATNLHAQSYYQTTADSKLRSGPSVKYKTLEIIKNGEKVNLIERINSYWFKIEHNGKTGFVSSKLLKPIVEIQKVEETPNIEKKIPKSNSTLPYVIAVAAFLLLLVIFASINKDNSTKDDKVPNQTQTNLKNEKEYRKEPIKKSQPHFQIKISKSPLTNSDKADTLLLTKNPKEETNKNNLISLIIDSIKKNAVEQLKKDTHIDTTTAKPNEKLPLPDLILPVKNNEEDIKQKTVDQVIKMDTLIPQKNDDSIIDVTGNTFNLSNQHSNLFNPANEVPVWKHQYVYSFSEINNATSEQTKFYNYFKYRFLKGQYIDLKGNTNYAFILLFDLIKDYENHKNLLQVERQLAELGQYYPKTKSYALSSLIKKLEQIGDSEAIAQLRNKQGNSFTYQQTKTNTGYSFDGNYWGLGAKYKSKLNLKDDSVKLLNKLWYPNNNFCSVEFCCVEILKLYIETIAELKVKYIQEGTTLDAQFLAVADVIARKHFKYKAGSNNYKYSIDSITNEFYSNIFKHCENAIREHYGHKRKVNTDTYYTTPDAKAEFETKIISKVVEILPTLVSKVTPPDEATEIELYSQNTSRWKIKFEELTANYKNNPKQFIESIVALGKLNKKNPSIENIFFEASKFISKHNKETALTLYVHYLYHDLKSAAFANKQLTKTIQKNLFKTNEQLHEFEIVVSELIKDKSLDRALQSASKIYAVKRKKIQLDTTSIKEVQHQHSGTVELLNEYLKDEYEDESNSIKTQEINSEEITIAITQKTNEVQHSIYVGDIAFTQIHTTALEVFAKSNFSVSQNELETFAKSKGVFKNQLIESINEICYENLDDVLIEEEDEYYTINPNYYQRLLAK